MTRGNIVKVFYIVYEPPLSIFSWTRLKMGYIWRVLALVLHYVIQRSPLILSLCLLLELNFPWNPILKIFLVPSWYLRRTVVYTHRCRFKEIKFRTRPVDPASAGIWVDIFPWIKLFRGIYERKNRIFKFFDLIWFTAFKCHSKQNVVALKWNYDMNNARGEKYYLMYKLLI